MNAHRARVPMVVALTTVALATVSVQSRLQPAPGAHIVTITPPGQTGSEPAIAVNPNNPEQVVGVAGPWAAYSTDGGRTFTAVRPAGDNGRSGGDPSLTFDDKGQLFYSFLSIQRNGLPGYWGHGPGANGIYVRRSADGGKTWDAEPVAVIAWKGDEADVKLEDMPRIWADTQTKSPHRGNLYMPGSSGRSSNRSSSSVDRRTRDAVVETACASARARDGRGTTTARSSALSAPLLLTGRSTWSGTRG